MVILHNEGYSLEELHRTISCLHHLYCKSHCTIRVIFLLIFGCSCLTLSYFRFFFYRPRILAHLCPHLSSINRALYSSLKHTFSYSHSFSLVLSSFLFYISSLILSLFIYSFLRIIFLVLRSSEIPRNSCCILRACAIHRR